MDPVSLTASITAILQLTGTLISYFTDVKNATKEQAKLGADASNLHGVLLRLRCRVEEARSDDRWFNEVKLLGSRGGPLDQFKQTLESLVANITKPRKRDAVLGAIKWTLDKKDVADTLSRIDRLMTVIKFALDDDLFNLTKAVHDLVNSSTKATRDLISDSTNAIQDGIGDVQQGLERLTMRVQTQMDQELRSELASWLGVVDPSVNYHAALKKRSPETGTWLVNSTAFAEWKTSASSSMWLHGNAGCGKTVLSATALEHIMQLQNTQQDITVAYFYFDFNDVQKQSAATAVRTLLLHLVQASDDAAKPLFHLYQSCSNGQLQPSSEAVLALLRSRLADTGTKYILMDALDECQDREDLLKFIEGIMAADSHDLHVLATSRRERDIESQLQPIARYKIDIQSAIVDEDIKRYVQDRFTVDSKLKKWPPAVKVEIASVMQEKSNGMFRWAFCQMDSIRHCVKPSDLRKKLSDLPKTLDDTYKRMLDSLDKQGHLDDAITALQWLCYASRPLFVEEMVEILAITTGDNGGFSSDDRMPDPDDVITVCSSLISCNPFEHKWEVGYNSRHINTKQIRLAHFSVKEYLLSDRSSHISNFQASVCHQKIAEGCLRYLLYVTEQGPVSARTKEQYPLTRFAAEAWWVHARELGEGQFWTVADLVIKLLDDNIKRFRLQQIYSPDGTHYGFRERQSYMSPVYYLTCLPLLNFLREHLPTWWDVNATGGYHGNALQAACDRGSIEIVELLLQKGAEVNAQGGYYGNALQAASSTSSIKIVEVLLREGAKVNAQGGICGNALQAACYRGSIEIVELLLQKGAEVNAQGGYYGNALQAASSTSSIKIVEVLLREGAKVNAQGGHYGNALQAACSGGSIEIVELLLQMGAEVNAQGGYYGNALQAVCSRGSIEIVEVLLREGAKVNAQGGHYGNALQAACCEGDERIVQVLLDSGANVNAQGGAYGTALNAARRRRHKAVKFMLLAAGAEELDGDRIRSIASRWEDEFEMEISGTDDESDEENWETESDDDNALAPERVVVG